MSVTEHACNLLAFLRAFALVLLWRQKCTVSDADVAYTALQ